MKKKAVVVPEQAQDDWLLFSSSYLNLANLACKEVIEERHAYYSRDKKTEGKRIDFFKKENLYIPTIYNMKHAIEIVIKTLNIVLSDELTSEAWSHNQKDIFSLLRKQIKPKDLQDAKNALIKRVENNINSDKDDGLENIKKRIINQYTSADEYIADLERLILKYQRCDFIRDKIKNFYTINDTENDAFRYPANGLVIELNYSEIIKNVTVDDFKDFRKDVEDIEKIFSTLDIIFLYTKLNKKLLNS